MSFNDTLIKMWQVMLVAIVSLIAGFSMTAMMPERGMHSFVRRFMGLECPLTIALSHDGILKSAEGSSSFTPWDAYFEVELADGFILVCRGGVADFIPLSAFPTEAHADEVARFISLHIKDAQNRI